MMKEYILNRDCSATVIPAGESVTLKAGEVVFVTQTLGGNITVRTASGLYRIAREDAPALADFALPVEPVASKLAGDFNEAAVWEALRSCFDPEIPVNIVDLGLVYDLALTPTATGGHTVEVKMTLTAPGCGMGPVIAEDARQKIAALPSVESAQVHIVWDPQWAPQMISPAGRKILGLE
jgi:probable FeS assembly SUF system protein SufT